MVWRTIGDKQTDHGPCFLRAARFFAHQLNSSGELLQTSELDGRRARERREEKTLRGHDARSEEHTSELQSQSNLVCRLLLEKKNNNNTRSPVVAWLQARDILAYVPLSVTPYARTELAHTVAKRVPLLHQPLPYPTAYRDLHI